MSLADPDLSVVVPTRDRPDLLAACLTALDAQRWPSYEVVVVDDASVDGEAVATVVAHSPAARLVVGAGRGPAAARNRGARAAAGRVLCFTDDDCRPRPEWLSYLARRFDAGARVVAGPTRNGRPDDVYSSASQTITNHLTEALAAPSVGGVVAFAPTSNVACVADVHRAVPFDEAFPLAAGEDRQWCDRLTAAGIPIDFEPAAWVEHHQRLSFRGFWRQQERYGRGAARLRSRPTDDGLQRPSFYAGLLAKGFSQGPRTGGLVVLAQVATAAGVLAHRRTAD